MQVKSDHVLKVVAGLFLSLLAFQGKQILGRLDRLEATQTRILFTLGIPPIASHTLDFQVENASLGLLSQNR